MEQYYQKNVETMPVEKIKELQSEKLVKQVKHVYEHVPYYRDLMDKKGVRPEDIHGIEDLYKLPFISKSDLREIVFGIYEISGDLETAVRFVRELEEKCEVLKDLPEGGAVPKDYVLKALGYRYLVHKHYLIFYMMKPDEQNVYIHAFFHEKLDYFRYMRQRI